MLVNIDGLNLQMVSMDAVDRTMIYDESQTDLCMIRTVLSLQMLFSPGGYPHGIALVTDPHAPLQSGREYSGAGGAPNVPNNLRGGPPEAPPTLNLAPDTAGGVNEARGFVTEAALRTRLWQPRKRIMIGWPEVGPGHAPTPDLPGWWLIGPKPGRNVDAKNGPSPLKVDVVQIMGEGVTFGVNYVVAIHEAPTPEDILILSHRWDMTHTHDDNGYLTRIIDGTVVFNGSEVDKTGVPPDWLRSQFFHPIPLGFRRYLDPVTASADGLTIKYRIRDVDQSIVFDPADSGAAFMEIAENVEYIVPWGATSVADAVGAMGGRGRAAKVGKGAPGTGLLRKLMLGEGK